MRLRCERDLASVYFGCVIYTIVALLVGGTVSFFTFIAMSALILLISMKLESLFYFYLFINFNVQLSNIIFGPLRVSYIINIFFALYFVYLLLVKKQLFCNYKKFVFFLILWWAYCVISTYFVEISQCDSAMMSMTANVSFCAIALYMSKRSKINLVKVIVFSYSIMLFVGYIELLIGHTFLYSKWTLEERYRFGIIRVGSTIADANLLCSIMVPMFFVLQINVFKEIIGTKVTKIMSILTAILTITTFSRAGIAAFALGIIIVYFCNNLKKMMIAVPFLGVIMLLGMDFISRILNYQIESLSARSIIVTTAIHEWLSSPLIGHGWDWFSKNSELIMGRQWDTMNTYVYVLVNLGIIGLVFFMLYYILISKEVMVAYIKSKTSKKDDEIFLIAMLLSWLVITYTLDEFNVAFLWVIPAIFSVQKNER